VRGIYLGNYVRWDPKAQHETMMRTHAYKTAHFPRTFDCYEHVDCYAYMDLHDELKLYKHGYSRVTDHAIREIRHGRLTRPQARSLVRRHEQEPLRHDQKFCEWLGVDRRALQFIMDRHRNPAFWNESAPGRWQFKGLSALDTQPIGADPADSGFVADDTLERGGDGRYIVYGKGWPA
jgi:hypothetical protein